ncbi:MAG: carbamoyltransferase HypF [Dehalococcoidia bacterium]|nr:carbamoyltransferase HypF [Dehalococcoidia bacterium]
MNNSDIEHYSIRVFGVVQGVGFRPFIYQLASVHNLKGWVRNTSGFVEIDIEGTSADASAFIRSIRVHAPRAAYIENIESQALEQIAGYTYFEIKGSRHHTGEYQLVSPDLATCPECICDIFDASNRRFGYPFTNCTNCGPRFTIIRDIPYDRQLTTMDCFTMCPDCKAEYDNPQDRRFHAQPNACRICGPQLELVQNDGQLISCADPLDEAARLLRHGKIVAIKGLGGFLLACDATNDSVVGELRQRKQRPAKPFAVMLPNVAAARRYCIVSAEEEELLTSAQSPIVLLKLLPDTDLSQNIAPSLKYLGVLLPYTPLHHLLMRRTGLPLVMTSGNLSEEPIACDNDEAMERLGYIADYFLRHDRGIHVRYDDSVAMVVDKEPCLVRRARGYAPYPVQLPFDAKEPLLACGADMKGAFCLVRGHHAFISQHIGDMENAETLRNFDDTVDIYKKLFRIDPRVIACDAHPDYFSTRYAQRLSQEDSSLQLLQVQHHHAHVASCMAENAVMQPVIGVALDGTGYGTDGNIWGGEFLLADYGKCERLAHFEYVPLPGGDASTRRPLRIAASYIHSLLGDEALKSSGLVGRLPKAELDLLCQQIERNINAPLTSSCGRLFDAVSAVIGTCESINYEAQAAIELEMAATDVPSSTRRYPMEFVQHDGMGIIRFGELFGAILKDIRSHVGQAEIAACFHASLTDTIVDTCRVFSRRSGVNTIALCGGVFQNRLLLQMAMRKLRRAGLHVITHKRVPTNDGGIALGQAAIAAFSCIDN